MTKELEEALAKRGRKWGDMNHQELDPSPSRPGTKPHTRLTMRSGESETFVTVGAYRTNIPGAE